MIRAILEDRKTQTRRIIGPTLPPNPLCPYGEKGSILWCKETFCEHEGKTLYRATTPDLPKGIKWKPSIFMPRRLSRITLKIDSIDVQRLHAITPHDAKREGFNNRWDFASLWAKINGLQSWLDNPFIWIISFHRANP